MTDTDMLYMVSLQKKLDEVEAENAELRARISELEGKHWNECRQIAHYDDERKKIREYLQHSAKTMTVHGVHEALALIGEDIDVPASADDTNVGHKSGGWISCKDKMPEDNTSVLFVYVSENGIKSVHYGYHQTLKGLGSSWAKPSGGWQYCDDDVTHWQPVPEPPKE
jgi:hypothetical protein